MVFPCRSRYRLVSTILSKLITRNILCLSSHFLTTVRTLAFFFPLRGGSVVVCIISHWWYKHNISSMQSHLHTIKHICCLLSLNSEKPCSGLFCMPCMSRTLTCFRSCSASTSLIIFSWRRCTEASLPKKLPAAEPVHPDNSASDRLSHSLVADALLKKKKHSCFCRFSWIGKPPWSLLTMKISSICN